MPRPLPPSRPWITVANGNSTGNVQSPSGLKHAKRNCHTRHREEAIVVWTTVVWLCILGGMTTAIPRPARAGRRFDSLEQEAFLSLWRTYDRLRAFEDELF